VGPWGVIKKIMKVGTNGEKEVDLTWLHDGREGIFPKARKEGPGSIRFNLAGEKNHRGRKGGGGGGEFLHVLREEEKRIGPEQKSDKRSTSQTCCSAARWRGGFRGNLWGVWGKNEVTL